MKILLVRLSSMGDLIHTLPAIEDLAQARADVELHWLCEAGFADIARLHPFVKKVHEMKWRQWRKRLGRCETWQAISRLKNNLRQERFDLVLDSQSLLKSALFAKCAGAPIWGLNQASAREAAAAWFYSKKFEVPKGCSAVWRNRTLFARAFDYEMPPKVSFGVKVPKAGCLNGLVQPYFVALHATSRDSKLWPIAHWRALLQMLYQNELCTVYLPWGNETEKARAHDIAADLPFAQVCEKMSLLQAAALLQEAKGVAGVDTGLLHLADAVNVPVVGIFTDTDPRKTGVQESVWAKNLGGVACLPEVADVYETLCACIDAKAESFEVAAGKTQAV